MEEAKTFITSVISSGKIKYEYDTFWFTDLENVEKIKNALDTIGVPFQIQENGEVIVSGTNRVDMLFSIHHPLYEVLCGSPPSIKMIKTDPNAIVPSKARGSDVGYDLTVIKIAKELRPGTVVMFDSGIQVRIPWGYYIEIVPRSSLSKTGWMLANTIGIIDPSYQGNLLVALIRVDPSAADIELPFRGFQLVVRRQHALRICECSGGNEDDSDMVTARGHGGFGSTGV
jgi:deoxyuridine 5'-triphosphate nucleotidohydrolase